MAKATLDVTVNVTRVVNPVRGDRCPDGTVQLVDVPDADEFTLDSDDWTARGYLSRIHVESSMDAPPPDPLVCFSVKRWDDEEWTGFAMTFDEARSLAEHLNALAGGPKPARPEPVVVGRVKSHRPPLQNTAEAGPDPEDVIERAIAESTPVATGLNLHDLESVSPTTSDGVLAGASWAARVVETDNYDGDYPDESFHGPPMPHADAERIASSFNKYGDDRRYYKVVPFGYKLRPGFEP